MFKYLNLSVEFFYEYDNWRLVVPEASTLEQLGAGAVFAAGAFRVYSLMRGRRKEEDEKLSEYEVARK